MKISDLVANQTALAVIESLHDQKRTPVDPGRHHQITSLSKLDRIFQIMDPLRKFLQQLTPGKEWSPPQIIVMGNESSGKSTILERIAMMPLFPTSEGTKTCM